MKMEILLTNNGDKAITKSGTGSFIISSSDGTTQIESVVFTGAAVSSVTTLDMSGNIDTTGGNILLTNTGNKAITHTGGGSGDLTVKSTNGDTKIESVVFDGNAVSSVSTISMSGDLTNTGNDILLTKGGAQSITKSGSGSFTISSNGDTTIESVVFSGNALRVSSVSTLSLTGNIQFSANTDGITAAGANDVTSFSEKSGNNACSGDSIDIGSKRFGVIRFSRKKSNNNACYHSAGTTVLNTVNHNHGSNYLVFLTTHRNDGYNSNPLLFGISAHNNGNFKIYHHNPDAIM